MHHSGTGICRSPILLQRKRTVPGTVLCDSGVCLSQTCDFQSVTCDHDLFVGGKHHGEDLAVGGGEDSLVAAGVLVELCVDLQSEEFHLAADALADRVVVLADSAGEDDGIETAHLSGISADKAFDLVDKDIQCELSAFIALCSSVADVSAVAGDPAYAEEAGFFVQQIAHLVRSEVFLVGKIGDDGRIDPAGACAHDESVQRSEAHGSVEALAVFDGAEGASVSEVADDDLCAFRIDALKLEESLADETVGGSMEAIAADGVLLIVFVGDREDIALRRHGLMEGGIEHRYHRNIFSENFLTCAQSDSLRRIVERSKLSQIIDGVDDFIVDQSGYLVDLTSVENTVSDGDDLFYIVNDLSFAGCKLGNDFKERFLVGGEGDFFDDCRAACHLMCDQAADADPFTVSLCDDAFVIHFDQLVFQAAGTRVDDQNFHDVIYSSSPLYKRFFQPYNYNNSIQALTRGHMEVYGIVCECNPFHRGHQKIARLARERGADAVVGVMSGDFVQRGEPAVISKFIRAEQMARNGFDLVIELPVRYALSSAQRFAVGAVRLMEATGAVDRIIFGSETGSLQELSDAADFFSSSETENAIRAMQEAGMTYPAAREKLFCERFGDDKAQFLRGGNDQLGIEYLRALKSTGSAIIPCVVRREQDGFYAHEVRKRLDCGIGIEEMIPEGADPSVFGNRIDEKIFARAVLMRLRDLNRQDFESLPDVSGGLDMRLYRSSRTATDLNELYEAVKTKRYTMSRVKRTALWAALKLTGSPDAEPEYARILAIGEKGTEVLARMRERSAIPFGGSLRDLSSTSPFAEIFAEEEIAATDFYNLNLEKALPAGEDFTHRLFVLQ